jgi:hypothetical protein
MRPYEQASLRSFEQEFVKVKTLPNKLRRYFKRVGCKPNSKVLVIGLNLQSKTATRQKAKEFIRAEIYETGYGG